MKKTLLYLFILCVGSFAWAQQTGSISGKVVATNGEGLPGVTISAQGDVLPQARNTVTQASGTYRLSALPPGNYELTFTMAGFGTVKASIVVRLQGDSDMNVTMGSETQEVMTVSGKLPLISKTSTEVKQSFDDSIFNELPLGEEYRDMVRLVPGVQVTEDAIRGPSAGGSGQDNTYKFDGVDVTLPMFGTLSSEPSSHDIAQIAIVKGGAQAVNFNRSGGMSINTISKSGTNKFSGEISFKMQEDSWTADQDIPSDSLFGETSQSWLTANIGGPIIEDRLFFFVSYYSPTVDSTNRTNVQGALPDGKSERDEYFFKFTWSPFDNFTMHASYRDSSRESEKSTVFANSSPTVTSGSTSDQTILILEGDWIVSNNGSLSFKYTDYLLDGLGTPDNMLSVRPNNDPGAFFDIGNLDQMGYVSMAGLRDPGDYSVFNQYMSPLLEQYGYVDSDGVNQPMTVGAYWSINDQDFGREAFQIAYDHYATFGASEHNFHAGLRVTTDVEDLYRDRNGWGIVSFQYADFHASHNNPDDVDNYIALEDKRFIQAEYIRKDLDEIGDNSIVHSEYKSYNIEINDNIEWGNWNFNVGVIFSKDELYGQGLKEDSSALSGYVSSPGTKYKMYTIDWMDMIQPRLGAVYSLNDTDTVQASYARYNPPATSLPRAASWARNYHLLRTRAFFNVFGELVDTYDRSSSSGKLFVPDMTPRATDEIMVGYSKSLPDGWTGKVNARYKKSAHFWEDTNNTARSSYGDTANIDGNPADAPTDTSDYIPDLNDYRDQIGSGSSYVIAELDGAYTKFYEVGFDVEKRTADWYFKGSYTWSHYYGNFDQDNTTTNNDQNIFIGSSNIADGAGRQLWDFKEGTLHGDRPHMLKVFGSYNLNWNGTIGAFAFYQSGAPWETWDSNVYRDWTSSSSDTIRYAEPAGSNRSDSHYQLDLAYTQRFSFAKRYNFKLSLDIFNVTDNQTGYNIDSDLNNSTYGNPVSFFSPRRYRLAASFMF